MELSPGARAIVQNFVERVRRQSRMRSQPLVERLNGRLEASRMLRTTNGTPDIYGDEELDVLNCEIHAFAEELTNYAIFTRAMCLKGDKYRLEPSVYVEAVKSIDRKAIEAECVVAICEVFEIIEHKLAAQNHMVSVCDFQRAFARVKFARRPANYRYMHDDLIGEAMGRSGSKSVE